LWEKLEGKKPLRRPKCRQDDNIEMDVKEMLCESVDWIHVAQDRDQCRDFVNTVTNL
jgi:hypothetical protein